MHNWNMIVIFTCHMFLSYGFWTNVLFILWFCLIFHCLKAGFVPCPGDKLMVPNLTTRDCEYYWSFLLNERPLYLSWLLPLHSRCWIKSFIDTFWATVCLHFVIELSLIAVLKRLYNVAQQGPFYWHGLTSTPAWISNYIHYKVWGEITYPFPNSSGLTFEVRVWINNIIPHFTGHAYPC